MGFTSSELTIAAGTVTATRTYHTVDTQLDAGTDDLDTIGTGSVSANAILILSAANTARTVVIKDNNGAAGSIHMTDNADYSLDDDQKSIMLQQRLGDWYELSRDTRESNVVIQVANTQTGAVATGTTTMPSDDTIPQNTEGDEYMTLAITPKNTANKLDIEIGVVLSTDQAGADAMVVALFQDATAGALAAVLYDNRGANTPYTTSFRHTMTAGTETATTFKVRAGFNSAGTTTFNGFTGARKLGGVMASSITIREYTP